jgi:hypothetical protein
MEVNSKFGSHRFNQVQQPHQFDRENPSEHFIKKSGPP